MSVLTNDMRSQIHKPRRSTGLPRLLALDTDVVDGDLSAAP